jgi:hypothetical protein
MSDSSNAIVRGGTGVFCTSDRPAFKRRLYCIAWLVTLTVAVIASIPTEAAQTRAKPFACVRTNLELTYQCSPQSRFLGVAVGMSAKDAFNGLCTNAPEALWSADATSKTAPSPLVKGLNCGFWPRFASSRIWTLRVNGYPCVRTRFIIIVVADGKIGLYKVWCHQILDNSLLVNEPGG